MRFFVLFLRSNFTWICSGQLKQCALSVRPGNVVVWVTQPWCTLRRVYQNERLRCLALSISRNWKLYVSGKLIE